MLLRVPLIYLAPRQCAVQHVRLELVRQEELARGGRACRLALVLVVFGVCRDVCRDILGEEVVLGQGASQLA